MDFLKLLFLLKVTQTSHVSSTTTDRSTESASHVPPTTTDRSTESALHVPPTTTDRSTESTSHVPSITTDRSTESTSHVPPTTTDRSTESTSHVPPTTTDRSTESALQVPQTTTDRSTESKSEFVYNKDWMYSYDEALRVCSKEGTETVTYKILYFYQLNIDESNYVYTEVGRNTFEDGVKIWTDLYVLSNKTIGSRVTGNIYEVPLNNSSKNKIGTCVVLIWNSGKAHLHLQANRCDSLNRVICREYLDLATTSSPSVPCPVCDCNTDGDRVRTRDEVETVLREIRKNLTLSKANLSSSIRKRISASDPRMSSQIIGVTLGISVLSFTVGVIIITDFISLLKFVVLKFCCRD
ncbi:uncharacterized protein LOC125648258 [Ostrea edulis]|uniref:uncharacterized protein LOC125648258 n=1 Tax=Ostrea edulis TaxID=37623 RepID=UPI0024AF55F7|nr:uncharacterized protein LOC125648258 [Ostrea edulis]